MDTEAKFEELKDILKEMGSIVIGFSGGVDSTFLLKVAVDVLGKENVLAVTSRSETHPEQSLKEVKDLIKEIDVDYKIIYTPELSDKEFKKNDELRCYYCKKILFTEIKRVALSAGFDYVADGSNYDDKQSAYRPGRRAVAELGVKSPLEEAKLKKSEIRELSKRLSLSTWQKPSFACLATRFPYGEEITKKKIEMVDRAEHFLKKYDFQQLRLRQHDSITARIEVDEEDLPVILKNRLEIIQKLKSLGYIYITLDLEGYRTGSMNEVLEK